MGGSLLGVGLAGCGVPVDGKEMPGAATAGESTGGESGEEDAGDADDSSDAGEDGETSTGDGDGDGDDADGGDDGPVPKWDLGSLPDAGGEQGEEGIPTTCASAANADSAVGCLFFGLDLDNMGLGEPEQFGIVVSNVQENATAEVIVEEKQNGNWVTILGPVEVDPMDSYVLELPDNHEEGSALRVGGAYRVTSDVPVAAYQFNPIDGQASYTTDASLLLPVASWDHVHQVIGYQSSGAAGAYITIIGAVDGTQVEITPAEPTVAGSGVPAGTPGNPFVIQLDEGDMVQIACELSGKRMAGTTIVTDEDHPVGVFTANECTRIDQGACDHMEEMLPGLRLWGTSFVSSRMPVREMNAPEATVWQIYASEDGTTVNIDASQEVTGLPNSPLMLNKGDLVEFWAAGSPENPGDFALESDKPIAVMSYLKGYSGGYGDPAMLTHAPVEQYLERYVLLVPDTWVNDYLLLTRPSGAQIEVDGVPVDDDEFIPVGNGDYEVARILTTDGVHVVDGMGDVVGASVVGYDDWDSYAYLGGVGTGVINPNPQN